MGILSRFHRVPPFLVGALCGGTVYVYYHGVLRSKYHSIPQSIWDLMYQRKEREGIEDPLMDDLGQSQAELYDMALNKRQNREYYRDSFIIGWNDSVRSLHSALIRNIFGEELQ
eukprot:30549_1